MEEQDAAAADEEITGVTKGPLTIFKEASAVAAEREKDRRAAEDVRDARNDERNDKAWTRAVKSAEKGQASAERVTKMVLVALGLSILANIVLVAMVLDRKLDVSADGVTVGAEK